MVQRERENIDKHTDQITKDIFLSFFLLRILLFIYYQSPFTDPAKNEGKMKRKNRKKKKKMFATLNEVTRNFPSRNTGQSLSQPGTHVNHSFHTCSPTCIILVSEAPSCSFITVLSLRSMR